MNQNRYSEIKELKLSGVNEFWVPEYGKIDNYSRKTLRWNGICQSVGGNKQWKNKWIFGK